MRKYLDMKNYQIISKRYEFDFYIILIITQTLVQFTFLKCECLKTGCTSSSDYKINLELKTDTGRILFTDQEVSSLTITDSTPKVVGIVDEIHQVIY